MSTDTEQPQDDGWGELADRLDQDYPPAWIPGKERKDTGEVDAAEILGTFVRQDVAQARGESCDILVLAERGSGELRSVWLVHTATKERIRVLAPAPGDRIAIRQLGLKWNQDHSAEYMDYKIALQRAGSVTPPPPAMAPTADDLPPEPEPDPGPDSEPAAVEAGGPPVESSVTNPPAEPGNQQV